jgi:hypothetical protein
VGQTFIQALFQPADPLLEHFQFFSEPSGLRVNQLDQTLTDLLFQFGALTPICGLVILLKELPITLPQLAMSLEPFI